jgi:penicillin V acylase-like amidase (Ntn superfamily)
MSSGGHVLKAGDSLVLQFSILAADNLKDLQQAADTAFWVINNRVPDGINEQNQTDNTMNMYPNPTSESVNLQFVKSVSGKVKVFSLTGNLVMETKMKDQKIVVLNVSELESGSYFIRVNSENKIFVKKLIKH